MAWSPTATTPAGVLEANSIPAILDTNLCQVCFLFAWPVAKEVVSQVGPVGAEGAGVGGGPQLYQHLKWGEMRILGLQ